MVAERVGRQREGRVEAELSWRSRRQRELGRRKRHDGESEIGERRGEGVRLVPLLRTRAELLKEERRRNGGKLQKAHTRHRRDLVVLRQPPCQVGSHRNIIITEWQNNIEERRSLVHLCELQISL